MACKDCEKRHIGCHANCEEYIEEKKQRKERNEKIWEKKDLDRALNTRAFERIEYAKKKKGAKK